jgi:transcription elongation factor SPT4
MAADTEANGGNIEDTFAEIPNDAKGLRACLRCSLVKTFSQFLDNGCENCEFLGMVGDADRTHECTTAFYEGTMAIMAPGWVAQWQRVANFMPGMYAIAMNGTLPDDMVELCESYNYEILSAVKKSQA